MTGLHTPAKGSMGVASQPVLRKISASQCLAAPPDLPHLLLGCGDGDGAASCRSSRQSPGRGASRAGRRQGRTVVLVTHAVALTLPHADHVIAMGPGGTVQGQGRPPDPT